MVKVVFDLLDVLAPDSLVRLKAFVVERWNAHCAATPDCADELAAFSRDAWQPDAGCDDRYALVRAFCTLGPSGGFKLALAARAAVYMTAGIADLHLTSDAAAVKCLLGLHELPDVSLWLLSLETPQFSTEILRRLPVAPFFEGVSRLWRVLNRASADNSRDVATHAVLARCMNALAHETVVLVSTLHSEAAAAAANGWVGVHLEVDVNKRRRLSLDALIDVDRGPQLSSLGASASAASTLPMSPRDGRVVKAAGIAAVGRVVLHCVPELLRMPSVTDAATPLLFSSQREPISKKVCICNCFWAGVGSGVGGTVVAVVGFVIVSIAVSATLRTFGVRKRGS